MRHLTSLATAFALVAFLPASADEAKPFIDNTVVDLTLILPPPPANDSAKTMEELGVVLTVQMTRTPEMVARAQADDEEGVWRLANVIGDKLDKSALPLTAAFFDRIAATEGAVVNPGQEGFQSPASLSAERPCQAGAEQSKSGAWPSGHASVGIMMGIALSNMLPEKRDVIMARALEFGENRLVAGNVLPLRHRSRAHRRFGAIGSNHAAR